MRSAHQGQLGRYADYASETIRDHGPGGGLGAEEGALQVGVEDGIPIRFGNFQGWGAASDAGVVDQDVEPTQVGGGPPNGGVDGLHRLYVHIEFKGGDAFRPDAGGGLGHADPGGVGGQVADGNVGAGLREANGQGSPDSAGGSGNQRLATGEVKSGIGHDGERLPTRG